MDELDLIADYISKKYSEAKKIVEVGAGKLVKVAAKLSVRMPDCELVVTDLEGPPNIPSGVQFERDDITNAKIEIYKGADLIYSIRTPPELQSPLIELSRRIDANLLIKPISGEEIPKGGKLINYQGASFYLFEKMPKCEK